MRQRHRWGAALVACVLALPAGGLRAEDTKPAAPMDSKALDRQLYETLRDVINRGADIYNGGDWNGCYRLYEGALITVRPMLAHRPELQKVVDAGLVRAAANPQMAQRAFDLRAAIDRIRDSVNPNPKPAPVAGLWERLGGVDNVKKVIDDFVATAGNDPKVDFFRNGKYKPEVPTLKRQLVEFVSFATRGPLKYTGRSMQEIHKGMGITDAQFNALAGHLKAALEKNNVKPDDVKAVLTAVEGTRKDIVEKASGTPQKMTLWDRLGGEDKVKKIIHQFVAAAAKDDKVDFDRKKTTGKAVSFDVAKLEKLLVEFVSEATGGPLPYTGRKMKESHKGMGITEAQFDAAAKHLKKALEDNDVKPADVTAVLNAVNGTRKDIVEPKQSGAKANTLWERLGGADKVKKVIDDVVTDARKDPKVDFLRGNKVTLDEQGMATLKKRLVEFVSDATGGPLKYDGKTMKESHQGMGITDAQFDAFAGHLKAALKKNGADQADIDELIKIVETTRKDIVEK